VRLGSLHITMTTSIPESSARVGGGVRFNISNEELTSSNRSYFNDLAHKSDRVNPLRERVLNDIAEAILEEFEFDEDKTELMEYACGEIVLLANDNCLMRH